MSEKERIKERIIEIVRLLVEALERAGISYFQEYPKAEFAMRGENIVVSLIDIKNSDIKCVYNHNLNQGKKIFYIDRKSLLNPSYNIVFLVHPLLKQIDEEIREDSAFKTNLERVTKLIDAKLYAIALVFIVSALESVLSDIFFRYNHVWFLDKTIQSENSIDDDLIQEYGSKLEDYNDHYRVLFQKEIDNQIWIVTPDKESLFKKWLNLSVWEYVYKTSKKFGFYQDYMYKLQGNKLQEIGRFEILKKTLKEKKEKNSNRVINFQSFSNNGINAAFKRFFGIELNEMKNERKILDDVIKKRHLVIHVNLKDDEVKREEIEQARDALKRLVAFLISKMNILENSFITKKTFINLD